MRKPLSAPRRIYTRNGITHVCFDGKVFGTASVNSELNPGLPVFCEKLKSDGGKARITVTHRRVGQPAITETWRTTNLRVKHRA